MNRRKSTRGPQWQTNETATSPTQPSRPPTAQGRTPWRKEGLTVAAGTSADSTAGEAEADSETQATKEEVTDPKYERELEAYRHHITEARFDASKTFDKMLLTLGGGALGLSLTFLGSVARNPHRGSVKWLVLSWFVLVSVLLLTLMSQLTTQAAMTYILERIANGEPLDDDPPGGWRDTITGVFNYSAAGLFVLGVAFMVTFAFLNRPGA